MAKNKKNEIFLMNEKSEHCSVMRMRKKHLLLYVFASKECFPPSLDGNPIAGVFLRPSRRIFILSHSENV